VASILKRGDKYRALVRKGGTTRCKTFSTKRDAEAWAASIERHVEEIAAHGYVSPRSATVAELIDAYDQTGLICNPATRSILRVARKEIGSVKLTDFNFVICMAWVERRMKAGATGSTVAVYLSTLGRVLKWAKVVKRIDVPAAIPAEVRAQLRYAGHRTKSNTRDRFPTAVELQALIAAFEQSNRPNKLPMADLIRVAATTAVRRAELCNLTVADFDPAARTLRVKQRKHPVKRFDSVIPVFEPAYSVIVRHCSGKLPTDRIFDVQPRSITRAFTPVVHRLGLTGVVWHSLRHYAATKLLSSGLTIPETACVTGHSDWSSLRRYAHITAQQVQARALTLGIE
jgi:integrase